MKLRSQNINSDLPKESDVQLNDLSHSGEGSSSPDTEVPKKYKLLITLNERSCALEKGSVVKIDVITESNVFFYSDQQAKYNLPCSKFYDHFELIDDQRQNKTKKALVSEKSNENIFGKKCGLAVVVIAALIGVFYYSEENSKQDLYHTRLNKFVENYSEEIYIPLANCVNETKSSRGPCVALILYSSFKIKEADDIANELATLGATDPGAGILWLTGKNISQQLENDSVVEYCKKNMLNNKVMLLKELHEVDGAVLRQFHSACDPYSQAKDGSALFIFTMLDKSQSRGTSPKQKAHETMNRIWGNALNDNILDPLITRLTNTVVYMS